MQRTIFSLDCAFKTGQSNDFSVVLVVGETKTGYYLLHLSRGRWEFPELKRQAVALDEIWKPNSVLIEDAASGQSLIQALKAETRLPILPVKPQGDKVSRAHAVSPLVESGRVYLPANASWLADFMDEATSFPAAPHDDMVDAFSQALNYLRGDRREYAFYPVPRPDSNYAISGDGFRRLSQYEKDAKEDAANDARRRFGSFGGLSGSGWPLGQTSKRWPWRGTW